MFTSSISYRGFNCTITLSIQIKCGQVLFSDDGSRYRVIGDIAHASRLRGMFTSRLPVSAWRLVGVLSGNDFLMFSLPRLAKFNPAGYTLDAGV